MRFIAAAVIALAALPAGAADPLSNSWWEAAYLNSSVAQTINIAGTATSADDDIEGIHLGLAVGFSPTVSFTGEFDQRRYSGAREALGSAGLALHTRNPFWQPYIAATYEQIQFDDNTAPENDDDDEGYGVEVGVRVALSSLELGAHYKHLDYGKAVNDADRTGARYGVLAALQLSPQWALSAQYRVLTLTTEGSGFEQETEYSDWSLGFRRYFATDVDRRKRKGGILFGENGYFADSE